MVEVRLENVTHIYDKRVKAVDNLNIKFIDEKLTALLGPSGCGKTTTLRIIAGLIRPTKGRVFFDDKDVTDLPAEKRNLSMVFQFPVVYTTMKIYDNLAFPLRLKKLSKEEIEKKVKEIAEFLGLKQYLEIKPIGVPADLKQKVALGRALIKETGLLLLDEPLTNIDPKARIELREKILDVKRRLKQTIIYVTHDQAEALTLADFIGIMKDGKIIQLGTPEEIYERPNNTFVAWFVGNPGMNLLDADLVETAHGYFLDISGFRLPIPEDMGKFVRSRISETKLILGIRPEHVDLYTKEVEGGIPGKCLTVEDMGALFIETVRVGEVELKVKTTEWVGEGQPIWIKFPGEKVRIFDKSGKLIYG